MENTNDVPKDIEHRLKRSKITQVGTDFSSLSLQTQEAAEDEGCGYKKSTWRILVVLELFFISSGVRDTQTGI